MTYREELERVLKDYSIDYKIPVDIHDKAILNSMFEICKCLANTQPSLLNINNLDTLIKMAKSPLFSGNDAHRDYSYRPPQLHLAINGLFRHQPCLLNQDTFEAICSIATANLYEADITSVAASFILMNKILLLTKANINKFIRKIINSPLRKNTAQHILLFPNEYTTGITNCEPSEADKLFSWLQKCDFISQEMFDFTITSAIDIDTLCAYMQTLHQANLFTPANFQALIESNLVMDDPQIKFDFHTQKELNKLILPYCDEKLAGLNTIIPVIHDFETENHPVKICTIQHHAAALYKKLSTLRHTADIQDDPRYFLHVLTVIQKALPYEGNRPTADDIKALITLGQTSPPWGTIKITLILLAVSIAVAIGAIFTTAGAPITLSIAAAVSSTGFGLFYHGINKIQLSHEITDLAEAVSSVEHTTLIEINSTRLAKI